MAWRTPRLLRVLKNVSRAWGCNVVEKEKNSLRNSTNSLRRFSSVSSSVSWLNSSVRNFSSSCKKKSKLIGNYFLQISITYQFLVLTNSLVRNISFSWKVFFWLRDFRAILRYCRWLFFFDQFNNIWDFHYFPFVSKFSCFVFPQTIVQTLSEFSNNIFLWII